MMHGSQVEFFRTDIPDVLLHESNGYKIGPPDKREIKCTQGLILNELKMHPQNKQKLKMANEILGQTSIDAGAICGTQK